MISWRFSREGKGRKKVQTRSEKKKPLPPHLLVRPRQALANHLALERRSQRRRGPRPDRVSRQAGLALLVDQEDEFNHRKRGARAR